MSACDSGWQMIVSDLCCRLVDHARVELPPLEGEECSDYINASYMKVRVYCMPFPTSVSQPRRRVSHYGMCEYLGCIWRHRIYCCARTLTSNRG